MKRWIGLVVFLVGCGVERGDSGWASQQIDVSFEDVGSASDVAFGEGPGAGTMDGTWLLAHEGSTCVLNDEQLTLAYYLVDIEQTGRVLKETRQLCSLDLSPILGLKVVVPEAVRASISFVEIDNGFVSDLRVGGSYASSTELALWGLELENVLEDELPATADDPRVVDSDNDGNPAVTLEIENSSCKRYQGQRQVIRYQGSFVAPNVIEGGSVNITDVKAYGSTASLCGIAPPILSNDPFSRFVMVRVDGAGGTANLDANADGQVGCDEIAPALAQILEGRAATRENCRR